MFDNIKGLIEIFGVLGAVSACTYGMVKFIHERIQWKTKEKEEYMSSFNTIVSNLTSENRTVQLSAAILLRRYLQDTKKKDCDFTNANFVGADLSKAAFKIGDRSGN